jgi:hypothetical protein
MRERALDDLKHKVTPGLRAIGAEKPSRRKPT